MHLIAINIVLKIHDCFGPFTDSDGVHAYAAVLQKITSVNPVTGRSLHDMERNKRLTVAIHQSTDVEAILRVTFMEKAGDEYLLPLITELFNEPDLQIGNKDCTVVDATPHSINPLWYGINTWNDLTDERIGKYLCMQFVTPTAITKRDDQNLRFMSLFPNPVDIYSGLVRRWQGLGGPDIPDTLRDYLITGGCVVSCFELQTVKFVVKERTQIGFKGWITYECRKQDKQHNLALNSLTRLALFTGIGYQTARGMGAVDVGISG